MFCVYELRAHSTRDKLSSVKLLNQTRFPGEVPGVPRFTDQATYATMLTKLYYLVRHPLSSRLGTIPSVDRGGAQAGLDA